MSDNGSGTAVVDTPSLISFIKVANATLPATLPAIVLAIAPSGKAEIAGILKWQLPPADMLAALGRCFAFAQHKLCFLMAAKVEVSKPNRSMSEIALWANIQIWRNFEMGMSALRASSKCGMADVGGAFFI